MRNVPPVILERSIPTGDRRPIAARSHPVALATARWLTRAGVSPNAVSIASVVFAAAGGALIVWPLGWARWVAAALSVQLRLLCNLLDGLMAVKGGKATPTGVVFNEIPDRVADTILLVSLGVAAGAADLGWAAALAAMATAWLRQFGAALGFPQDFSGIMAKPRRMAALTACLLAQPLLAAAGLATAELLAGCAVILIGSAVTCVTRTRRLAGRLSR